LKKKKTTFPTINQTNSQTSLILTSKSVKRKLDRAMSFEKPSNGPMSNKITVDIINIDENESIEAKNLIYITPWG